MILLTVDEIAALHSRLLLATGGLDGLRDRGLLESAAFSVNAGFEETEHYPTIEEKVARLAFSLVKNHPFVDGNKRIGILSMLTTLKLNNVMIVYTQKELIDLGLSLADGTLGYEETLKWILKHKK